MVIHPYKYTVVTKNTTHLATNNWKNYLQIQTKYIYCVTNINFAAVFSVRPDAVLSCEFRTEKDQNPRIEWKKKGKTVTFVYFNHKFTGE